MSWGKSWGELQRLHKVPKSNKKYANLYGESEATLLKYVRK